MPDSSSSFTYFLEGSLTDPSSKVFIFRYKRHIPIFLNFKQKDLEIHFEWTGSSEDVVNFTDLIQNLIDLKLLSLDIGVQVSDLMDLVYNKPILLNKYLSKLCSIHLDELHNISQEIEFDYLGLTQNGIPMADLCEDFPEFILDFGEALEEDLALCYINSVGILKPPYSDSEDMRGSLEFLCSNYLVLEIMNHVVGEFHSTKLTASFTEYIEETVSKLTKPKIISHRIEDTGFEGEDVFLNMLHSERSKLPSSPTIEIYDLYDENVFVKHRVFRTFDVYFNVTEHEPKLQTYLLQVFKRGSRRNCIYPGRTVYGKVNWHIHDHTEIDFLEYLGNNQYVVHFHLVPRYSDF